MQDNLRGLLALAEKDPDAFRVEVRRLQNEDPELFDLLVEAMRQEASTLGRPRRFSSMSSLARGDVDELVAKHKAKSSKPPR